jgi:hypothetical protein
VRFQDITGPSVQGVKRSQMVEFFSSFSTPYWSGVATTLALLTAVIAVYQFFSNRKQAIYFEVIDEPFIPEIRVGNADVQVSCNGIVGKQLHRRTIFIINRTKGALDDTDFVGAPFSCRKLEGRVYRLSVITLPSSGSLLPVVEDQRLNIKDIQCPRDASLLIEILHDGCISGELTSHTKNGLKMKRYQISTWQFRQEIGGYVLMLPVSIVLLLTLVHAYNEDLQTPFVVQTSALIATLFSLASMLILSSRWFSTIGDSIFIQRAAEKEFRQFVKSPR